MPSAISCSLSPLVSRIYSCLISDWRRIVSFKFVDPQAPSISTEELAPPRHVPCVLSRLRCNGHSLLLSSISIRLAESIILPAAHVDTRPRTPLISFCTVQLRTLYAACSLATLYLCTTSGPSPGKLLGFWGSMVFRQALIPRKGSCNNNSIKYCNFVKLGMKVSGFIFGRKNCCPSDVLAKIDENTCNSREKEF